LKIISDLMKQLIILLFSE